MRPASEASSSVSGSGRLLDRFHTPWLARGTVSRSRLPAATRSSAGTECTGRSTCGTWVRVGSFVTTLKGRPPCVATWRLATGPALMQVKLCSDVARWPCLYRRSGRAEQLVLCQRHDGRLAVLCG